MEHKINLGTHQVQLTYNDFDDVVDVDELTKIDYGNIVGEVLTIPALMNRVGMMRAEAEKIASDDKLALSVYEADFKLGLRKEASKNEGFCSVNGVKFKLTEKALETAHCSDRKWQELKNSLHLSQKNVQLMDSLYWGVAEKAKKLTPLMPNISPEEFVDELVEGKINGFFIKKDSGGGLR